MNISLSTSKKSILEIFIIEIVEHVWIVNDSNYLAASVFSNLLILITNGYLLWFIIKRPKKTFLDRMMFFDCILCISNIFTLVHISYKLFYCHFIPFFSYFINLCNRLLTVGIVFYRYVCVIKHNWVRSTQQRKTMEMNIFGIIMMTSLGMTAWAMFYKDESRTFLCSTLVFIYPEMSVFIILDCTNELHNFYYDFEDFYREKVHGSPRWNLPLTNFFHVLTLICFMGNIFITPIGYGAIFRFRKNQDNKVAGISSSSRKQRRNRNLVTMKFNLVNWILETCTTILVAIVPPYRYFTLLYILVNSCGTPLVYFLGIEENRTMAKEYLKANINKPKRQVSPEMLIGRSDTSSEIKKIPE